MCIPVRVIVGVSPYGCCVEAKKLWDPQGISSSNVRVSIADHSHTVLAWGSRGISKDHRQKSPSKFTMYSIWGLKWWHSIFVWAHDYFVSPLLPDIVVLIVHWCVLVYCACKYVSMMADALTLVLMRASCCLTVFPISFFQEGPISTENVPMYCQPNGMCMCVCVYERERGGGGRKWKGVGE